MTVTFLAQSRLLASLVLVVWGGTHALATLDGASPPKRPIIRRTAPTDTNTFDYTSAGVRVIQRKTPGDDIVGVELVLPGGVLQLTPANAGIEDLVLRTLQYGSARYPGPASRRAFARTGSRWHADAGSDWSSVGFVGLSSRFDSTWVVFADRITHPTLDSTSVALVRTRMIRELRLKDLSPEDLASSAAESLGVAGHPYANPPYGSLESIASITPAQAREYASSQLVKSRMVLVVVGNVPRAHLDSLVSSTLGTLPAGQYVRAAPPPWPDHRVSIVSISRPTSTGYIVGWFAGPPFTDKDYPAFEVATGWLSARLERSIRERNALSYAAYATANSRLASSGELHISTNDPKTVAQMIDPILDTLKMSIPDTTRNGTPRFVSWYLGDFSKGLRGGYMLRHETNMEQAAALAEAQVAFGDYREAANEVRRLNGVGLGDVLTAARRYIQHIQFVYVGDTARFRADWIRH